MSLTDPVASVDDSPVRVVVVDDHPLIRNGVRTLLSAEHDIHVVGEADDGSAAIEVAQEVGPDLVVMDVSLPKVGGVEATRRILAVRPTLRVLAFSAHEDVELARIMLQAGASGYVLKRSAAEQLVRAIRNVAVGSLYVDSVLAGEVVGSTLARGHRQGRKRWVSLSEREAAVVRLLAQGQTSKEIASELSISARTVETYRSRAMGKLDLRSRVDLVRYALRCGWLRDT